MCYFYAKQMNGCKPLISGQHSSIVVDTAVIAWLDWRHVLNRFVLQAVKFGIYAGIVRHHTSR